MRIGAIEQALHLYARLRNRLYKLLLLSQFKEAGRGVTIVPPFRFYGLNQIVLGAYVHIERDCWIQTVPGQDQEDEAKLIIGSHSDIGMGATISAARRIEIGDHVLLARNVYISDHRHGFEDIGLPIMRQRINGIVPVSIGRETWLGQNAVVLPGANIGVHCVIGANSIVNSPIPDFSVAVGAPARVIRRYNQETGAWERVADDKQEKIGSQ